MKKLSFVLAAALTATAATSLPAQTFRAENRVTVTGLGDGTFSVPSRNTFGARGTWCAAADYPMDVLGAAGTDRVYVRRPIEGNSGPVVFGLTPGDTTPSRVASTSAGLHTPGANLSIDHAFQFCYDARLINRWWISGPPRCAFRKFGTELPCPDLGQTMLLP